MNDFEDFVAEALLLLSMLQKTDPVSFFVLGKLLHQSLQTEDDGSASFLLNASAELLYILEDPIRVQTCLRNIFEMIFDGMERAKQRERFEKLCRAYPDMYTAQSTNLAPKVLTSLYFSPVSVCYNHKKVEGLHGKSGNIFEYGCLVITFRREQLEIVGINP